MADCAPRFTTERTVKRPTLGSAAAKIAVELGTPLMPWQQHVLDVALEVDEQTKRLAYREVVLTVPRQSGKTTLLLVLILLRALGAPHQTIVYTAQTRLDARKKWVDGWLPVLEASRFGSLYRPRFANGQEGLLFKNGSVQSLVATTKKTGHGATLDLGILDEAFAHPDARLEQALRPAMITRPQPQLWVVSTAGTPQDSPYLLGKVEIGREAVQNGLRRGLAYFEWSAPEDADPTDPETWYSCMPALGRTTSEEAVRSDFATMDLSEFERAYLNRWKASLSAPVIPLATWRALVDPDSKAAPPYVFAFDVTPERSSAAITVGSRRPDGLIHLETVEQGPGTSWVVPRLDRLVGKHGPAAVVCDAGGPAASLVPECERIHLTVTTTSAREFAQACGMLFDAVTAGRLRHLDTPELAAAIDGAVKRPLGDAWAWSRKSSGVDISPLVAATLSVWGVETLVDK